MALYMADVREITLQTPFIESKESTVYLTCIISPLNNLMVFLKSENRPNCGKGIQPEV
jgi:hypothetical protein